MGWLRKGQAQKRVRPNNNFRREAKQSSYSYFAGSGKTGEAEKSVDLGALSRWRQAPTIAAIVVIISSLLYSLTLSSRPSVTLNQGEQSPYRPAQDYVEEADRLLKSKLAYRTKLTINTEEVEQGMLDKFPELKAAVLRLPLLGRKPTLVIEVGKPALIMSSGSRSFVLNESGVAVSELAGLLPEAKKGLLSVTDQSGLEMSIGKQIVTSETVEFIVAAVAQLKAQNQDVSQLTLPTSANQLDIQLSGEKYFIKTDISGDARLQIGSFLAVRDYLRKRGQSPKEYVDVRVEEKVFYK